MRRLYIVIAAAAGLYLDSVFFARVNISGIRPDAIMALTASLGVLLGMKKGALFGLSNRALLRTYWICPWLG